MPNAIFTAAESTAYDDQIEDRYHFPSTYLKQAEAAIGDFVIFYEPRRGNTPNSGRSAYFAFARLDSIEPDPHNSGHHYANMSSFMEFDNPVPFKIGTTYIETALVKEDGSTNKGAFGRSVRNIPINEFATILRHGFTRELEPWEASEEVEMGDSIDEGDVVDYVPREIRQYVLNRKFRDQNFKSHVRTAYNKTCAVTGLRLINGGGRPEVQAAHIRSVEKDGPDTVRNGIALTGTVHWLFDRGLISFTDDHRVLVSSHGIPDGLDRIVTAEKKIILPENPAWRPHPTYLRWHRENCFKS